MDRELGFKLRELALVIGAALVLFCAGLGRFGLVGPDEPRYAQVAREMLQRSDFVSPTLLGQPWLEKPILYYWQAALAYKSLGVGDSAARLPSAIGATILVLGAYLYTRRFRPGCQLDVALLTTSSAAMVGFAHGASTDMALTAPFGLGMLSWLSWRQSRKDRWLWSFHACLGLAVLAKGPVAVLLAGLVILPFAALVGDKRLVLKTLDPRGIGIFLAVAAPWYMAVHWRNPSFIDDFILRHNFDRFLSPTFRHEQPWWFYAMVLLGGMAPWSVLVVRALTIVLPQLMSADRRRTLDPQILYFGLWGTLPLLFFSVSRSKLPGYALPAIPAWALLLATLPARSRSAGAARPASGEIGRGWLTAHLVLVSVLAAVAAAAIGFLRADAQASVQALGLGVLGAGIAAGIAAPIVVELLRRRIGPESLISATFVATAIVLVALLELGGPGLDRLLSARPVALELARLGTAGRPIAVLKVPREVEFGLSFYRDQPVARYNRAEQPSGEHVLVARAHQPLPDELLDGRNATEIGRYGPQGLVFFRVTGAAQESDGPRQDPP